MAYIDTKNYDIFSSFDDIRIESSVFEVDDFIAPIISRLNKKGYKTLYCCSGHYRNIQFSEEGSSFLTNSCYIMFSEDCCITTLHLPNGFIVEGDTIRKNYESQENTIYRFDEIVSTTQELS